MALFSLQLNAEHFASLYERMAQDLLVFLTRRTGNPDVALDLVSQTFVEGFAKRGQFRGRSLEQAESWLWSVGRRQLSDYWRRGQVERKALEHAGCVAPRAMTDDEYERVEALAGTSTRNARLHRNMQALPEEQRSAVYLRIVQEREYDDIAVTLSISEQAARARVSRGLRTLAERMDSVT